MSIKVAVVEDHKETREMLATLINESEGYECVATFEDGESALEGMPALHPDVALVDIHLPGESGIGTVRKLKASPLLTQYIMCTSLEDTENIFSALQAGARGYMVKSSSAAKILEAITDVYNGGSPMSSQIARKVVASFEHNDAKKENKELSKLSAREQEILTLLAKGYRYKEIAGMIFISIETVRKHIHNIYEKLEVNSRIEAVNKVQQALR